MSNKPISPLRQRMIDDMSARRFSEDTERDYVRNMRNFTAFLGRPSTQADVEVAPDVGGRTGIAALFVDALGRILSCSTRESPTSAMTPTPSIAKVAQLHRRLQPFCHLHDCSGCFRLERSPGGALTHWKTPPCHGAHVLRTLRIAAVEPAAGGKRSIALNAIERLPRAARSPAGGIAALVVLNHDWLATVSNSRAPWVVVGAPTSFRQGARPCPDCLCGGALLFCP